MGLVLDFRLVHISGLDFGLVHGFSFRFRVGSWV